MTGFAVAQSCDSMPPLHKSPVRTSHMHACVPQFMLSVHTLCPSERVDRHKYTKRSHAGSTQLWHPVLQHYRVRSSYRQGTYNPAGGLLMMRLCTGLPTFTASAAISIVLNQVPPCYTSSSTRASRQQQRHAVEPALRLRAVLLRTQQLQLRLHLHPPPQHSDHNAVSYQQSMAAIHPQPPADPQTPCQGGQQGHAYHVCCKLLRHTCVDPNGCHASSRQRSAQGMTNLPWAIACGHRTAQQDHTCP